MTRRIWFERLGWLGMAFLGVAAVPASIRFLRPPRTAAGRTAFDAGALEDYRETLVTTRWIKRYRVWVVRERGRLIALHARCPHLGCTPRWEAGTRRFRCPCHGSQFSTEGVALNGPAKNPLQRAAIWREGDRVMVDPGRLAELDAAEPSADFAVTLST